MTAPKPHCVLYSLDTWTEFAPTFFDESVGWEKVLRDAVQHLRDLCAHYDVPFAAFVQVAQDQSGCHIYQINHVPRDLGKVATEMLLRMPSERRGGDYVKEMIAVIKADEVRAQRLWELLGKPLR